MNDTILISVLMPAYNASRYITEAIDSVLKQTHSKFELIIINDGSTDNTLDVIKSFDDNRIRVYSQENKGVASALNLGLSEAKGDYIARFDADDVCYPHRLKKQLNFFIANPDYVMVGSDVDYITETGEFIFSYEHVGYTNEELVKTLKNHCSFTHSSVMYLKKHVLNIGGYEIKAHLFEDYFLWKKLILCGKVCNIKEPLIKVRFNPSSVTVDEKDQDAEFTKLKRKALETGNISKTDAELMIKLSKKITEIDRLSSYNRMLCKKYLWNNYQPIKARFHILSSLKLQPSKISSYLLLFLTFLPASILKLIYSTVK